MGANNPAGTTLDDFRRGVLDMAAQQSIDLDGCATLSEAVEALAAAGVDVDSEVLPGRGSLDCTITQLLAHHGHEARL